MISFLELLDNETFKGLAGTASTVLLLILMIALVNAITGLVKQAGKS